MHVQMASGCLMFEMAATASESNHTNHTNHVWIMRVCFLVFVTLSRSMAQARQVLNPSKSISIECVKHTLGRNPTFLSQQGNDTTKVLSWQRIMISPDLRAAQG